MKDLALILFAGAFFGYCLAVGVAFIFLFQAADAIVFLLMTGVR